MRPSKVIIYALIFLIGVSSGYFVRDRLISDSDSALDYVSIRDEESKYTHPLLDVLLARNASQNIGLRPFKKRVEKLIKEDMDRKWADTIAVYFRDLNNGPWFSIGETNEFYPASLLKVPLMMAVLKQAETTPEILKEKIQHNRPDLLRNTTSNNLELGKYYTVDDLLGRMIIYSDNVATNLLLNIVDKDILEKTYTHLGIIESHNGKEQSGLPDDSLSDYKISIHRYASFFRVLYNASYLNREMSEKALGLLARTEFRSGLNAGVPSNIEVSHKWGYREFSDNSGIKQLHDCGIIYYPKYPYLLCVMTAGNSFEYLDDAIREISRVVYKEVDSQKQHK